MVRAEAPVPDRSASVAFPASGSSLRGPVSVSGGIHTKRAYIFDGHGLAERKRLIYQADGALQEKLDAYVSVMSVLAKELGKQKWVPDITMNSAGADSENGGNAAMGFMNLWMMKTAQDLGVELTNNKKRH